MKKINHKKIFRFSTSIKDEIFFKNEIHKYIKNEGKYNGEWKSFGDFLWLIIFEINKEPGTDEAYTSKYLYFNEWNQKLYVDRDFREWAESISKEIEDKLNQATEWEQNQK